MELIKHIAHHPYEGKITGKIRKIKWQNSLQVMKIL